MSAPRPRYEKLPGCSYGGGVRARLWLGEDHLVEVHSLIFAERYYRYPLADIRAIVIRPSRRARIWTMICGGLLALSGLAVAGLWLAAGQVDDQVLAGVLRVFAGFAAAFALLSLLVLVINLARGPSCRCLIQTSGGQRAMAAPTRQGNAERMLQRLTPEIEAAQAPAASRPADA